MKTILVPTDFSKCSYNATHYAMAIAKALKAKIILLHIYQNPLSATDLPLDELINKRPYIEAIKQLKEMCNYELRLHGNNDLEIGYEAKEGLTDSEIISASIYHGTEMIVMGTHGASGMIKKYILGSNTASVISKAQCPVLSVPENAKYFGFKRIVFASDFRELKNNSQIESLLKLALLFNSEILILTIRKNENGIPSINQAIEGLKLNNSLKCVPHSFHNVVSDDVADAIDKFTNTHIADLLVTVTQKHSFLQFLFNKSITRNLVFHTNTPILSIPETK